MLNIDKKKIKKNIGVDASNIIIGGALSQLIFFLNYYSKNHTNDFNIILFCNSKIFNNIENKDITKINIGKKFSNNLFLRFFWVIFLLPKLLKKFSCDYLFSPGGLVFFRNIYSITMFRNMQPFQLGKNTLYGFSFKSVRILLLRILFLISFKISKKIIFLSEFSKKIIDKKINLNDKGVIINHGTNFRKNIKFSNEYLFKKKRSFVYVSSFEVYKNHIQLIKAFYELRKNYDVSLTIIGSSYKKKYNEILKIKNKLDPNNEFLFIKGHIEHKNIMKIYNNYDVGVHASSCENFPNIVIEMLSQGLPIITSDIPVMREILGNDYIFFKGDDVNNIVKKISDFLQNRKYFNYLNNRKKIFRDRYNLDNQQKKIFSLFNEKNV
jgi:glycosyltransferase involved in cell wall biosynthesis